MCSISKMAAKAEGMGNDRENLEEQSCHFTVALNGAFVQQRPAGCPGKLKSPFGGKLRTGCKPNSPELIKYARCIEGPTQIPLQFGSVYQQMRGKEEHFFTNCECGDGI